MTQSRMFVVGSTARVRSRAAGRTQERVGGAGFNIAAAMLAAGGTPLLISVVGNDLTDAESAAVAKVTRPPLLKVLAGRTARFDFTHTRETQAPRISSDYGVSFELTAHANSFAYEDACVHVCCRRPLASDEVLCHALSSRPMMVSVDFIESSVAEHIARIEPFLASVAWMFVNEREFEVVKPYLARSTYSGYVVVTRGRHGAYVLSRGRTVEDAEPVRKHHEAIDPTGAGDALIGTFLTGLLRSDSVGQSLRNAVEAGSRAVTAAGMDAFLGEAGCLTS